MSLRYLSFVLPFSASKRKARSSGSHAPNSKVSILNFPSLFLSVHHLVHAQLDINSRNSATAGNHVGVTQSTHTSGKQSNSGKSKPTQNSTTTTADTYGLSDEDDSVEQESIMQSPPKGIKRLESGVSLHPISLRYYCFPDPSCRLLSRSRLAWARIRRVAQRNTSSIPKSYLVGWDLLNRTLSTSIFLTWLHGWRQDLSPLVHSTFGIGDLEIRTPLNSQKAQRTFNW
jgi:hypothetical protein